MGFALAMVASVVMSFCAVTTRLLKGTPPAVMVFYHTIGGLILTGIYMIGSWLITGHGSYLTQYTAYQLGICFCSCLFEVFALLGVTVAYQSDSSGFVALISYMNIVYAYICD